MKFPRLLFLLACALASVRIHTAAPPSTPSHSHQDFPGWPIALDGIPLDQVPLTGDNLRFAEGFPGETGIFFCGGSEVILRWIDRPTRMLHPPSDCLRAIGFTIESKPVTVDADGRCWGTFEASDPSMTFVVRTRIYDSKGNSWTDASSWFWSAASGKSKGPWWSETHIKSAAL